MKLPEDSHKKMMAVYDLLSQGSISVAAFESVRTLVKGLHPGIDKKLEIASKALDVLQKIQAGDVISLTSEHLPEETDQQKKRKKALLFFIHTIKDVQSEIQRVDNTFAKNQENITTAGQLLKYAKGPFGLITLAALVIVIGIQLFNHKTASVNNNQQIISPTGIQKMIQIISYNGKQLPLSGLYIGYGADCDSPHYHATGEQVTALDGTIVKDPGGCGFGRVKDVQVTTVQR